MKTTGWRFPSSEGGSDDGFNDAGIETYTGAPFEGLAREIIQNSLDASIDDKAQVTVKFELVEIKRDEFPDADGLFDILKQCHKESAGKDKKEEEFFRVAAQTLNVTNDKVTCLKISDSGTTGLTGDYEERQGPWHAITKGKGITDKRDPTAGGSFGIGKNAPFTVSRLRTVFYSTRYKDGKETVYRAQGKSILKSHSMDDGGWTQGTGFYGIKDGCQPLVGKIPEILRPKEQGCVVLVAGFDAVQDWQRIISTTVIANYFCAIDQGKLRVVIRDKDGNTGTIEKDTLQACFKTAREWDVDSESIKNSFYYYQAMKSPDSSVKDKESALLGHCKMWVLMQEGAPKKVALLRKTGMLITDSQRGLMRWVGHADFVGVFMCESPKGNELLRAMENPQHNAFEPERAIENKRKRCKKALKEMCDWIRSCIDSLAKPEETEVSHLDELAEFFPDLDAPETIAGDEERDIEGEPVFSPKPIKHRVDPDGEDETDGEDGGAGENDGQGGGVSGHGSGHGDGTGGTGDRGGKAQPANIRDVRVVADAVDSKRKTVYFTPTQNGNVHVQVLVVGDDGNTEKIPLRNQDEFRSVEVRKNVRISLNAIFAEDVRESIIVRAFTRKSEETSDETATK